MNHPRRPPPPHQHRRRLLTHIAARPRTPEADKFNQDLSACVVAMNNGPVFALLLTSYPVAPPCLLRFSNLPCVPLTPSSFPTPPSPCSQMDCQPHLLRWVCRQRPGLVQRIRRTHRRPNHRLLQKTTPGSKYGRRLHHQRLVARNVVQSLQCNLSNTIFWPLFSVLPSSHPSPALSTSAQTQPMPAPYSSSSASAVSPSAAPFSSSAASP